MVLSDWGFYRSLYMNQETMEFIAQPLNEAECKKYFHYYFSKKYKTSKNKLFMIVVTNDSKEEIKALNELGRDKIILIKELIDKKSKISKGGKVRQEISKKLKKQNQYLLGQNQKLKENINFLENRQNTIFEKMDVIVNFLGKLSNKFLTLIDFKAKRNLAGYFEEIEKINDDFQEINKTHFLRNDDFSNIVFNSIQELPDHPEIKKDLKTKLKI